MEQRLGQGKPDNHSVEQVTVAVRQVKGDVERALQYFGTSVNVVLASFYGELSTDPSNVGSSINDSSLRRRCYALSSELRRCLYLTQTNARLSSETRFYRIQHEYLMIENSNVDIVVDPTLGQFLVGHNHIFVGTHAQLRELVLEKTGDGKEYQYSQHWFGNTPPEEVFEEMWGN